MIEQSNKVLQENVELRAQIAKLRASQPPQITNIASLDDSVELRYQTSYFAGASTRYTDRVVCLTWRQIFLALAGLLDTSKTDIAIFQAFKEAVKEADVGFKPDNLNATDKVRIKVQMIALGLISARVANTVQGRVAEFLSLTEKGRKLFIEGMVTRKA